MKDRTPDYCAELTNNKSLVKEGWEDFCEAIVSPYCDPASKDDIKRAFYAGAYYLLASMQLLTEATNQEKEGPSWLRLIQEECFEYADKAYEKAKKDVLENSEIKGNG